MKLDCLYRFLEKTVGTVAFVGLLIAYALIAVIAAIDLIGGIDGTPLIVATVFVECVIIVWVAVFLLIDFVISIRDRHL